MLTKEFYTTDECIEYQGKLNNKGYGNHRKVYEDEYGKLPKGIQVMHTCDNRKCVNIRHLKPGTNRDNMLDMVRKGRYVVGNHKGEAHGKAKLNDEEVMEIRRLYHYVNIGQTDLARKYGVGQPAIWKIVTGRTWTHLPAYKD